jgi:23S rRNA (cytosine1962-C5)-methyltransferase
METSIYPFILKCRELLSEDPLFFLINSYTTGLQPAVLSYMLHTAIDPIRKGRVEADEVGLPVSGNGLVLPCGAAGRWTGQHYI